MKVGIRRVTNEGPPVASTLAARCHASERRYRVPDRAEHEPGDRRYQDGEPIEVAEVIKNHVVLSSYVFAKPTRGGRGSPGRGAESFLSYETPWVRTVPTAVRAVTTRRCSPPVLPLAVPPAFAAAG